MSKKVTFTKAQSIAYAQQQGIVWSPEVEAAWNAIAVGPDGQTRREVPRTDLVKAIHALHSSGRLNASANGTSAGPAVCPFSVKRVPLATSGNTHIVSEPTKILLEEIGGNATLLRITSRFYPTMFRDKQLSKFVTDETEPHPERLADWITEKMSGEPVWSGKLHKRKGNEARDRSSAHFKAWNSPKRGRYERGEHFMLDDAVMWMRLMFWAVREEGLDTVTVKVEKKKKTTSPPQLAEGAGGGEGGESAAAAETMSETAQVESPFMTWYIQFVAHFIRVYERRAVPYAREAAEWSLDPSNIARYEKDGWLMKDIAGVR